MGKAGGLAVLWRKDLKICRTMNTDFTIELLIDKQEKKTKWWCICIYANSKDIVREEQCKIIERRKNI